MALVINPCDLFRAEGELNENVKYVGVSQQ